MVFSSIFTYSRNIVGGMHVALEYLLGMVGYIYHPSTGEVGHDNHKSKLFP